jgi:hypothetical protein
MITSTEITRPKYFMIFRGACIFFGVTGLVGSLVLILLTFVPSTKEIFEAQGQTFLLTIIGLLQSLGLLIAGIWLFKLKEFGRILILACIIWNLLRSIYFEIPLFSQMPFITYTKLFLVAIFLADIFTLLYFLRRDVKAYIMAHP